MTDRVAGLVIVAVSLLYGLGALRLKATFLSDPVGPKAFPLLLAVLLCFLGLMLLFRADPEPLWPPARIFLNLGLIVASFVAYAYLLIPLGFIAATTLETGFVSQRFGGTWWQALLTGLGISLVLYALFVFALGIPLPTGRVFGG